MGLALYPTRLYYRNGVGAAKHRGEVLERYEGAPPRPPIGDVREIDFWPVRGDVRLGLDGWREMTHGECCAVLAWLDQLAEAVKDKK